MIYSAIALSLSIASPSLSQGIIKLELQASMPATFTGPIYFDIDTVPAAVIVSGQPTHCALPSVNGVHVLEVSFQHMSFDFKLVVLNSAIIRVDVIHASACGLDATALLSGNKITVSFTKNNCSMSAATGVPGEVIRLNFITSPSSVRIVANTVDKNSQLLDKTVTTPAPMIVPYFSFSKINFYIKSPGFLDKGVHMEFEKQKNIALINGIAFPFTPNDVTNGITVNVNLTKAQ